MKSLEMRILDSEITFLKLIEKEWPKLSWRKWEHVRSVPWDHPLKRRGHFGDELRSQGVSADQEMSEGTFNILIRLSARTNVNQEEDIFKCSHFFSFYTEDRYSNSGRKMPVIVEGIVPEDIVYPLVKKVFLDIQEQAAVCKICKDVTRNDAVKTLTKIFERNLRNL